MLAKIFLFRLLPAFCFSLALALSGGFAVAGTAAAAELILPKAETAGGMGLMDALSQRKCTRAFSDKELSEQDLSNILWAAWGINRPNGKRTVPTAMNKQNVRLFAALASGVWEYDAAGQKLLLALEEDARSKLGGAPLTLLYAAEEAHFASGMHVGSMYQNVGLYCASAGLGNWVKRSGSGALDGRLPLPEGYRVFVIQSVGHPR